MITAVTGGIAEGKSTVLGYLAEMGFKTLSADSVARDVFLDPEVNFRLAELVRADGPIAAAELRDALFQTPEIRRSVNRLMHPRIVGAILESGAEFVEVPLLIEACLQGQFDQVWVVTCGLDEQRRRLIARYGPGVAIDQIMGTQLPSMVKIPFADDVIRTNCGPQAVRRSISLALQRRLRLG